jgi:class 3 adenylate cyclase/predicted ATPase
MNFCGACGSPVRPVEPPPRERRLVSVLFCDVVGFTKFSESRDFEDVRDVLDQYFAAARRIVDEYGGMIEKFIGDAVMALWGAPTAREDDAVRSVRAGMSLAQAVAALAERLGIPELRVRVGVVTGEAAVQLGRAEEGMVTGDAVNTAARIQSIADPGTVFVDDTTRLATERSIAFEPAGAHELKGKSALVRVWRALGVRDDTTPSGAIEPPLVGRDPQLRTIADVLVAMRSGHAEVPVVCITGDAGIGKSRLASELEKHTDDGSERRWHRGRSLSIGEGNGLGALAEVMRLAIGIRRGDPAERHREVVDRELRAQFADDPEEQDRVRRAVRRLLDLDDGEELIARGELFSAWRALFERLAAERPVVLVFEETQLADDAMVAFIAHLREWTQQVRIGVLVLSRPDPRLAALTGPREQIELEPLSVTEMDELVGRTVDGAPEVLLDTIRADGGGVPLYAVETLRALADRGVLAVEGSRYVVRGALGDFSVPPTIRALVSSRLDRLSQVERRVLFAGAVLGESFSAAGAAAVAGVEEVEATTLLDGLVAKALLGFDRDEGAPLLDRYTFLQGVVRRVANARLPRRERKRSHLAAADHLARGAAGEPDLASVLAGHLLAAIEADPGATDVGQIRERARTMLQAAAERAAAVGAVGEALARFDHAAELSEGERDRAAILERAGFVAYRAGDTQAARDRYRAAQQIHAAAGRMRERIRVRAMELRAACYVESPAALLPEARELYGELGDERDAIKALAGNVLAYALYQSGEAEEALSIASLTAEAAEQSGDYGELAFAYGVQGGALQEMQRPAEAIACQRRCLAIAEEHDPARVPATLANLAVELGSVGRYREAATHAREAVTAAERRAERLFERHARLALGRALCSLGEWDEAVAEVESVLDHLAPFHVTMAVAPLVVIALGRGQGARVGALVDEHDRRTGGEATSVFESDFRVLRSAAVAIGRGASAEELSRLIGAAEAADYAEWTGWLAPIVDRMATADVTEPLEAALSALRGPGEMKRTAPVMAQAARLEAHIAARRKDHDKADDLWAFAQRLAGDCEMAFESAVITLERAEHAAATGSDVLDGAALANAIATFERLGAVPWLARYSARDGVGRRKA